MLNLFGKKKTKAQREAKKQGKKAPTTTDTIAKMRGTLDAQEKRKALLNKKMIQCIKDAKAKSKRKDKRGALMCLKRKKMYEQQVIKIDAMSMNIENQIMMLESAVTNKDAVDAMQTGASTMKELQANVKVEDVEDVRDDLEELQADADEVSNMLSEPMGAAALDDEDDLLAELDEMEAEDLEADLLAADTGGVGIFGAATEAPGAAVDLPSAPTSAPAVAADDEEDAALKALEAEMGM